MENKNNFKSPPPPQPKKSFEASGEKWGISCLTALRKYSVKLDLDALCRREKWRGRQSK